MALIISFQNVFGSDEVSDYKVDVWVNERRIDGPFYVRGHKRSDGWKALARKFTQTLSESGVSNAVL